MAVCVLLCNNTIFIFYEHLFVGLVVLLIIKIE